MSTEHHGQLRSLGFSPQKGLTQGDVKSPLGWIAFFDILLTALKQCRPTEYPKTTVESPELGTIWPSAYMDDLTTATCSHEHTQEVADLVSAANALFGTEAAFEKFRAISTHPVGREITIRNWQWTGRSVQYRGNTHVVRVLGAKVNIAYTWEKQVREAVMMFQRMGTVLHASRVSSTTKVKIINLAIILKAGYGVGLAAWPEEYLDELDEVITRMARRALSLPSSYPSELIHDSEVGFRVLRLKDQVLQAKSRMATRCLEGPGPQAQNMRGLYNRTMRDGLGRLQQGRDECQAMRVPASSFLSTLCKAGAKSGYILSRKGPAMQSGLYEIGNHPDIMYWPQGVRTLVMDYHIHFLSELVNWQTGQLSEWLREPDTTSSMTRGLLDCLEQITHGISTSTRLPIRRGHVLEFTWGDRKRYFEVSGYLLEEKVFGGFWYQETLNAEDGPTYIEPMNNELGKQWASGGGRCDIMLISQQRPVLVFLKRNRQHRSWQISGRNPTIQWSTTIPGGRPRHNPPLAPWTEKVMDVMKSTGRFADCITSDASYLHKGIPCNKLWEGPAYAARRQGALVFTDREWREGKLEGKGPILVVIIRNFPDFLEGQANGTELVSSIGSFQAGAAMAESIMRYPLVETDCESIIRRGMKENSRYGQRSLNCRRHGYLYQYARRVNKKWPNGIRSWIQSHPERRKGLGQYTGPDARILIADKYAGGDDPESVTEQLQTVAYRNSRYGLAPEVVISVDAQDIMEAAFSNGDYYWAVRTTGCPTTNPLQARDMSHLSEYLKERTQYAAKGSKFKWNLSQTGLLKYMWKKNKPLKSGWELRAAVQDVFDKRSHQRNLSKGQVGGDVVCPVCGQENDSQAHYALRCNHPLLSLARGNFTTTIFERIDQENTGPGKAFIFNRYHWALDEPREEETVRQGMHRMALLLGRPTPMALATNTIELMSRKERDGLMNCVTDLWVITLKYLQRLWRLRSSILSAPMPIQQRLRTSPATEADVAGMLDRPYSQRDRTNRTSANGKSLARFCQVKRLPPTQDKLRSEDIRTVSFEEQVSIIHTDSAWSSSWIPWIQGESETVNSRQATNHSDKVCTENGPFSCPALVEEGWVSELLESESDADVLLIPECASIEVSPEIQNVERSEQEATSPVTQTEATVARELISHCPKRLPLRPGLLQVWT